MGCGSCSGGGGCGCSSGGCSSCPLVAVHDWLPPAAPTSPSYELVQVAFKGRRRDTYRNSRDLPIQSGDYVVVGATKGIDFGYVTMTGELVRRQYNGDPTTAELRSVIRSATVRDIERYESNREAEKKALRDGRAAVRRLKVEMKMVDAEWQFDRRRLTFYFSSERRVDFRQLVRDLARRFRTRVDLRAVKPREEAARIGGVGSCGRELCCSTWLTKFKPVTTQAAKKQSLPLNPARLMGQCGRLKCCLNYELEQYMEMLVEFPKLGTKIATDRGKGSVDKLDIFTDRIWVQYPDGHSQEMTLEAVRPLLGSRKGGGPASRRKRGKKKR